MKLYLFIILYLVSISAFCQSAKDAIDFINGKGDNTVHSIFVQLDEGREFYYIKDDGTVLRRIERYKDHSTGDVLKKPQVMNETSHLRYMNPFNIQTHTDSKDIFWVILNTTNGLPKVKIDYYGRPIAAKSIEIGPFSRSSESNIEERLKKAIAIAVTHFGGKPDSF